MKLEQALKVAEQVVSRLSPYCQRIEVAGSVRRRRPIVKDIDLVLIPSDPWNLEHEIRGLGQARVYGDKLKRIILPSGIQVDLYFARPETWATLLLIRTGSKENNIRLCLRARELGYRLHADGDGLFDGNGRRIAGETEESIYGKLGLPYQRPEERG